MAATSQGGGSSADADGPAMLAAETELLEALERLSSADSDEAWHDAVTARNKALRRLLIAVSYLPLDTRGLVVTRAIAQSRIADRTLPSAETNLPDSGVPPASE
jgi:hypothetical protein